MRKKWLTVGIFFAMMLANTVYANNTTTVSYTVNPAYTVLIPVDTEVEFNQLSESFGKIQVENAQLDEGKCIEVSLSSDGVLKNKNNRSDVIPYQILKTSEATPFVQRGITRQEKRHRLPSVLNKMTGTKHRREITQIP